MKAIYNKLPNAKYMLFRRFIPENCREDGFEKYTHWIRLEISIDGKKYTTNSALIQPCLLCPTVKVLNDVTIKFIKKDTTNYER